MISCLMCHPYLQIRVVNAFQDPAAAQTAYMGRLSLSNILAASQAARSGAAAARLVEESKL